MIHEVELGRQCDTLNAQLEKTLSASIVALLKADTVIKAQVAQIKYRDELIMIQSDRVLNYQAEKQELKKQIRQQKILTIAIGVVSVIALIIIL